MTKSRCLLLPLLLCATVAGACSEGAARLSPTAPTPAADLLAAPAATSSSLGDRSRTTVPATGDRGAMTAWASGHGWAFEVDGLTVEGTDTITAVSGVCPALTITVRGVPVSLTAVTTFGAGLACASLAAGTSVKVTGLLTVTDKGFAVTAIRLEPGTSTPTTGGSDDDGEAGAGSGGSKKQRGEGTIGAITGSCPTLTLVITGTRVRTTAATSYVNGNCETLRPGTKVKIDAVLSPGGEATAETIEILRTPGRPVSGDGRVSHVTGTCPEVTLNVQGVTVLVTATTVFTAGTCESLQPGSHIDVTGDYDGTQVTATEVKVRGR